MGEEAINEFIEHDLPIAAKDIKASAYVAPRKNALAITDGLEFLLRKNPLLAQNQMIPRMNNETTRYIRSIL